MRIGATKFTGVPRSAIAMGALTWVLFGSAGAARAFQVDPLPADNLVKNPWFRSVATPSYPGLDDWSPGAVALGLSQKESNPSPDLRVAPDCKNQLAYCGTGLRWAEQRPECPLTNVGKDASVSQIVAVAAGRAADRFLRFHTWWVSHRIQVAEVNVYGADSASGPFAYVWKPFFKSFDYDAAASVGGAGEDRSEEWVKLTATTPQVETELTRGYAFYKIEIHARYAAPPQAADKCGVGVKMTGLYFTTSNVAGGGVPVPPAPPGASPEDAPPGSGGAGGGAGSETAETGDGSDPAGESPGAASSGGASNGAVTSDAGESGCSMSPARSAGAGLVFATALVITLGARRRRGRHD